MGPSNQFLELYKIFKRTITLNLSQNESNLYGLAHTLSIHSFISKKETSLYQALEIKWENRTTSSSAQCYTTGYTSVFLNLGV